MKTSKLLLFSLILGAYIGLCTNVVRADRANDKKRLIDVLRTWLEAEKKDDTATGKRNDLSWADAVAEEQEKTSEADTKAGKRDDIPGAQKLAGKRNKTPETHKVAGKRNKTPKTHKVAGKRNKIPGEHEVAGKREGHPGIHKMAGKRDKIAGELKVAGKREGQPGIHTMAGKRDKTPGEHKVSGKRDKTPGEHKVAGKRNKTPGGTHKVAGKREKISGADVVAKKHVTNENSHLRATIRQHVHTLRQLDVKGIISKAQEAREKSKDSKRQFHDLATDTLMNICGGYFGYTQAMCTVLVLFPFPQYDEGSYYFYSSPYYNPWESYDWESYNWESYDWESYDWESYDWESNNYWSYYDSPICEDAQDDGICNILSIDVPVSPRLDSFDEYYDNEYLCWIITPQYNEDVWIMFDNVDIEYAANCRYDSLVMTGLSDGLCWDYTLCGQGCQGYHLFSPGNSVKVEFSTDSSVSYTGFELKWRSSEPNASVPQIGCHDMDCLCAIHGDAGYSTSKDFIFGSNRLANSSLYHADYDNNEDFRWHFIVPSGEDWVIELQFVSFDLETDYGCSFDYVQVFEGPSSDYEAVTERVCGTVTPSPLVINTNSQVMVHFHSDSSVTADGFQLLYNGYSV